MIHCNTNIKIPFLWGKSVFNKSKWTQVNLIVGPNGSGKTLLAQEIKNQFEDAGYKCRFFSTQRDNSDEVINTLNNNFEIRLKVENVLSNMFAKSIKFEKNENNQLVPMVINKARNVEYNLKDQECHGLKEILTLLVSLYSSNENCLIYDEPELHLHPQFQLFFMNEIQKVAKLNKNKIFFLITHSPFFIDLKSPKDLIGVVVCHTNTAPTFIEKLSRDDDYLFKKFLPRFNTYHKQFFFSDNQIFVEGYTDQQMFSLLLSRMDNHTGTAGTGIIDVGGKDELGVFCKVCNLLGTNARIIGDLDSLFRGKLRDVVAYDKRVQQWLNRQFDKQKSLYKLLFPTWDEKTKITYNQLLNRLEDYIIDIGVFICQNNIKFSNKYKSKNDKYYISQIMLFVQKCKTLYNKYPNPEELDIFKTVVLQGIMKLESIICDILPLPLSRTIPLILNLQELIFAASEAAKVYFLSKGCIEHYYTQNKIQYMPISSKDKLFRTEYNFLLECNDNTLNKKYKHLLNILQKACSN